MGMKAIKLGKAIKKPIPELVRQSVLSRAGYKCEDCGESAKLELHHLTYRTQTTRHDPDGVPIYGKETPEDLAALCRSCHYARHCDINGAFWSDPEEMAHFWQPYFYAMNKND